MTDTWQSYLGAIQGIINELNGDQHAIYEMSKRWRTLATNATTDVGAVKRAVTTVDSAWNGDASDSFKKHMAQYPTAASALSSALTSCADKLDTVGTTLESSRREVQSIYTRVDEKRKASDGDPSEGTQSELATALQQARAQKQLAVDAVGKATDEINKHFGDDVKFFESISAPGDEDFVAHDGSRWIPDPDFRQQANTQLAAYHPNGNGTQDGYSGSNGVQYTGDIKAPPNALSLATNPRAKSVIDYALNQLGDRYVWGATGPDTFDCSGLTLRAYEAAGIPIPRVAADQWSHGPRIPDGSEQAGDLIFFDNDGDGSPDHVGIVLDPKKHTMIHAPNSRTVVQISNYADYPSHRVGFTRPGMP
ncbi:bifunctional WXG100 family type VII secretion target/C40 family peptidase [Nonomuraea sediminis]|uniref:bifunctional WXG100 family type VII secretion target/C40 family peptidase n=1 Tax=Nonomuraea sediminis TaxID=2835864 RepID=UPI0027DFBA61|nr:NlpC/P60 family protein [Nonomuraea sediminis]